MLGFNYGAKEYGRVKKAIVFTSFIAILYTTGIWLIVDGFPAFFIRIFNQDAELIAAGIPAIRLYFFGFFMMSLQFSGQSIFVGLGKSKKAIFFSIFRKVIIVVPLTILLPDMFGMHQRRIRRRTDFQLCRRNCLLWNDAFDDLERIDEIAEREGFLKIERLFI